MQDLLRGAIRDPFVDLNRIDLDDPPPIWKWYKHLVDDFPLLTCQRWKYVSLNEKQRPSTYPLSLIVASILRDEAPLAGSPFLSHLNARRMELAKAPSHSVFTSCHPSEGESWPGFRAAADVPEMPDGEGWSYSLYEEVGRELCLLIDDVDEAVTEAARSSAKKALDAFLKDLRARRLARRPTIGPSAKIMKSLDSEAKTLLGMAWRVFDEKTSERSSTVLASLGVTDSDEQRVASLHLALPVLSSVEVRALSAQLPKRATARRCAVHLLAHRLGIPETTIAPKVGARSDLEYYRDATHPISG